LKILLIEGDNMPHEFMRDEMLCQLDENHATEAQKVACLAEWNRAVNNCGLPLPCPLCYLKGEIKRLKPISELNGIAVVRCTHCRYKFEYASPETR